MGLSSDGLLMRRLIELRAPCVRQHDMPILQASFSWEPAENIHPEILTEYEAGLEAEAQLDAEEAAELTEDEGDSAS